MAASIILSLNIFILWRKKRPLNTVERITLLTSIAGNIITFAVMIINGVFYAILIGIIVLAVVILGLLWERLWGKNVIKKIGNPILIRNKIQYYLSRDDFSFEEIVSMTESSDSIKFASVTHEHVSKYESNTILGAVIRNVNVTIMIMNPDSRYVTKLENVFGISLADKIKESLDNFSNLKNHLPVEKRDRLIIKTYEYDIPYSIMVVQTKALGNLIKVEEYHRFSTPFSRVNKAAFEMDSPSFYGEHKIKYDEIELSSMPY